MTTEEYDRIQMIRLRYMVATKILTDKLGRYESDGVQRVLMRIFIQELDVESTGVFVARKGLRGLVPHFGLTGK